uniref:Signal recognition particle subunit SRP72 n=1 Tax=Rhabditophanes sp. KR3021 TaxID=114890 RepID=A0AC35UGR8_9BILA
MVKKNPPLMPVTAEMQTFEDAYVALRRFKYDECEALLQKLDQNDVMVLELKAQLYYRVERYEEAAKLYEHVLRNFSGDSDTDRYTNYAACLTMWRNQSADAKYKNPASETYEQVFNYSCFLIEDGKYVEALKQLEKAKEMCIQFLRSEEYTEQEIEEELAIIRVQIAYAYQKLNKTEEAKKVYDAINHDMVTESTTLIVLLNNLPTVQECFSLNDARKKLKSATKGDVYKLNNSQKAVLAFNQAVIAYFSKSTEQVKKFLNQYKELAGEGDAFKRFAFAEALRTKDQSAITYSASSICDDETRFWFTISGLLRLGDVEGAANYAKEKVPGKIKNTLSFSGLLASFEIFINSDHPEKTLVECAVSLEKTNKDVACKAYAAAVSIADKYAKDGCKFVPVHENLLSSNDKGTVCRLIKSHYQENAKLVEKLSKAYLSNVDSPSTSAIDVDKIEKDDSVLYTQRPRLVKEDVSSSKGKESTVLTGKLKKRVVRKRKQILPKNFDPKKVPDPERWIPKMERTNRKQLSKKLREKNIGKGSQGLTGSEDMDYSNKPANLAASVNSPKDGPRQQVRNNAGGKKKKKGK